MQPAIVLGATEDECTVTTGSGPSVVQYARPFPKPREGRVVPGHLVVTAREGDRAVIVWRWFDAVVVEQGRATVTLWEPNHGVILARPRDHDRVYTPGSRAYTSSGLPGSQWWVAGPAVDRAEDASVEIDEVRRFYSMHGLWEQLVTR